MALRLWSVWGAPGTLPSPSASPSVPTHGRLGWVLLTPQVFPVPCRRGHTLALTDPPGGQ